MAIQDTAKELQRLRVQDGEQQPALAGGSSSAAMVSLAQALEAQEAVARQEMLQGPSLSDIQVERKVMALCTLINNPNSSWEGGGMAWEDGSRKNTAPAIHRLLCIPQHCSYAELVGLLVEGLPPYLALEPSRGRAGAGALPAVRVAYSQPSSPSVWVPVADDRGVSLMWEEVGGWRKQSGQLLHLCWQLQPAEGQEGGQAQRQLQQQGQGHAALQQGQQGHGGELQQRPSGGTTASTPTSLSGLAASSSSSSLASLTTLSHHMGHLDLQSPDPSCEEVPPIHIIPSSHIKLLTLLSSPSSLLGQVYEAEWGGSRVAVRWLRWPLAGWRQYGDAASKQALLRSAAPLMSLRHPNLVEIYGVVLSRQDEQDDLKPSPGPSHTAEGPLAATAAAAVSDTGQGLLPRVRAPALVMEWVGGGSLRSALSQRGHPLLRSAVGRLQLAADVAAGMAYLHSRGVVHFMLQPGCILLGDGPYGPGARVGGYELPSAKLSALMTPQVAFRPDVLPYLAPELHKGGAAIVDKADVFSFGLLLWELWAQKPPYDAVRFPILVDSMRGSGLHMRPIIPGKTTGVPQPAPGWRALMERCWAEDPQQRPSFEEVCHELKDMAIALEQQLQQH